MSATRASSLFSIPRRGRALSAEIAAIYVGLLDFVMLFATGLAICALYVGWDTGHQLAYFAISIAVSVVSVTIFYLAGLYHLDSIARPARHTRRMVPIMALVFLLFIAFLFALKQSAELSRVWVFSWFVVGTASLLLARIAVSVVLLKWARAGKLSCNIVVIGAGDHGRRLIRHLTALDDPWNNIVGVFDDRRDRVGADIEGRPLLGNLDDLVNYTRHNRCDEILVALPWSADRRVMQVVDRLRVLPVHVSLGPDFAALKLLPTSYRDCAGVPVLNIFRKPIAGRQALLKRTEDWLVGGLITLSALPIMILIAALIKLDSRGPVLFKQRRYGFNNQLIEIYKFRTMKADQLDRDGRQLTAQNDPRVTRVGRFLRRSSLDELPQFFNVIKGEMSIVGPRPHALEAKAGNRLYQDVVSEYAARHRVKPGITGWAQVNGWRGETDNDEQILERVNHDIHYIENWSLGFDLKIILRTVGTVLGARNAV